jgi:hypothetical protein
MKCWLCGVEPCEMAEIPVVESTHVRQIPIWPPNDRDHVHAEEPPTPEELLARANWLVSERLRVEEQLRSR